jgi:hypothetical protein
VPGGWSVIVSGRAAPLADPDRRVRRVLRLTAPVEVSFDVRRHSSRHLSRSPARDGSLQFAAGIGAAHRAVRRLPFDHVNDGILRSVSRSVGRISRACSPPLGDGWLRCGDRSVMLAGIIEL